MNVTQRDSQTISEGNLLYICTSEGKRSAIEDVWGRHACNRGAVVTSPRDSQSASKSLEGYGTENPDATNGVSSPSSYSNERHQPKVSSTETFRSHLDH